jgi:UDP-N-acetyl-D-galactosamine dehydrogenase
VILAGRRINDTMSAFVAQRVVKMLIHQDRPVKGARVGVLGLTFKEDVNDLRNSKVPDILAELRQFGIEALLHDPGASAAEARHEYGLELASLDAFRELDALVVAVAHRAYVELGERNIVGMVRDGGVLVDIKSAIRPASVDRGISYWSL